MTGRRPAILVLIRHGDIAEGVPEPRMSGWSDFPLSPLGRRQVEALARRMVAAARALEPVALYSSPLVRALDTARAVAGPLPVRIVDDLREICCGEVDGWPVSQVQARYPDFWETNLRQDDEDFRWPGGESYRGFRERCLGAVRRIASEHPGERVVLVTHAGFISEVVGSLHGTSPAEWDLFRPGNCSLTEIEWQGAGGAVLRFNDRSHLEALEEIPALPRLASRHRPAE